jgi:hypothetical protein
MGLFSKGSKAKAPAAPDPLATATQDNLLNRLNTYSATGSGQRFGYTDPTTGQFVEGTPPKGAQAAVQNVESGYESNLRSLLEGGSTEIVSALLGADIPDRAQVKDTSEIAKAIYDKGYSLLEPSIAKNQSMLLTNLQNRGLPVGSEAFDEAYSSQQRETEDTLSRLAQSAVIGAGQEQSRQYQIDSSARSSALDEILTAMGGGFTYGADTPSGAAAGSDYSSLVANKFTADTNIYNQNQANKRSAASTIGSIAGSIFAKCSMEFKDIAGPLPVNIAAEIVRDIPLMVWRYKAEHAPEGLGQEPHVGPMAEHFHAMTNLGDDKSINLLDAVGVLFGALQNALHRLDQQEQVIRQLVGASDLRRRSLN